SAVGLALSGDDQQALRVFQSMQSQRQKNPSRRSESSAVRTEYEHYVLERYLQLLVARDFGKHTGRVQDAFNVADSIRVGITDRAVISSAARVRFADPRLSELARLSQDTDRQISARYNLLASALSLPTEQNAATLASLRSDIEKLKQAQATLSQELEQR